MLVVFSPRFVNAYTEELNITCGDFNFGGIVTTDNASIYEMIPQGK